MRRRTPVASQHQFELQEASTRLLQEQFPRARRFRPPGGLGERLVVRYLGARSAPVQRWFRGERQGAQQLCLILRPRPDLNARLRCNTGVDAQPVPHTVTFLPVEVPRQERGCTLVAWLVNDLYLHPT